ncbi:MAG: hypothetical protein M1832_002188 [Thelocarpon impressellum]|nr:MAG: hypothetical protein M1832_002188 [Thelocarpon impressellum]
MAFKTTVALTAAFWALPGLCSFPLVSQNLPVIPPFQLSNITVITQGASTGNSSSGASTQFEVSFQVSNFATNTSATCAISFTDAQPPAGVFRECGQSPENDTTYGMVFDTDRSKWQADAVGAFSLNISSAFQAQNTQVLPDMPVAAYLVSTQSRVQFAEGDFKSLGSWNDNEGRPVNHFLSTLKYSYPTSRNTTGWSDFGKSNLVVANSKPYNQPSS